MTSSPKQLVAILGGIHQYLFAIMRDKSLLKAFGCLLFAGIWMHLGSRSHAFLVILAAFLHLRGSAAPSEGRPVERRPGSRRRPAPRKASAPVHSASCIAGEAFGSPQPAVEPKGSRSGQACRCPATLGPRLYNQRIHYNDYYNGYLCKLWGGTQRVTPQGRERQGSYAVHSSSAGSRRARHRPPSNSRAAIQAPTSLDGCWT